ncbi:MAG: hypothetical protein VSS75_032100 [Candidatus Parabeggiatoa sp.]|nr:hypothetical protein [Candidatus Parabeggiatoa sp.]
MIIRSKIPQPKTGFFSLMIWPFVKMKAFIDEVYQGLLSMIWAELFKNEANHFSELTHIIAFLILSVLSMLFYHFEGLEDIVILSFFALWLIDTYLTKLGFKTNKYERIVLDINNSDLTWKSFTPGEAVFKEQFKRADITKISLAPITHIGGAFGVVQAQVWRIFIVIHDLDGYLIYEEKNFTRALKKARHLADDFKVPLKITNSVGKGDYVAEEMSPFRNQYRQADSNTLWKTIQTSTTVQIYKKFSVTLVKKMLKSVLKEAGVFLFLVIMAGVMVRFGMLLTFLIGPKIGLESPTLVLYISFTGVLSFFAPKIDYISLMTLAFAIAMLLYSGFQHSREHRITINHKLLRYRIKGQAIAQLVTKDINQLILLREPKPALLIIGHSDKCIEIDKLEDDEEAEALYHQLLKQLEHFKRE